MTEIIRPVKSGQRHIGAARFSANYTHHVQYLMFLSDMDRKQYKSYENSLSTAPALQLSRLFQNVQTVPQEQENKAIEEDLNTALDLLDSF